MATSDETTAKPEPKAQEQPAKTEAVTKRPEVGFRADNTAYPGVDPDTGERKAVTWSGLREEFGEREGARLYNAVAIAAFGGVQPGKPSLSLITAIDEKHFRSRQKDQFGRFTESEDDYEKAREKFRARGERVKKLMADAEATKAKGV
jgi:hypothetical protein